MHLLLVCTAVMPHEHHLHLGSYGTADDGPMAPEKTQQQCRHPCKDH